MTRSGTLASEVAASLALASRPCIAAPGTQPRPTFKTEANYVRVDVFPTKDGAPVTDLTQADFESPRRQGPAENRRLRARRHPRRRAAGRAARAEHRARVAGDARRPERRASFVLFLDIYHVEVDGSRRIRKPLVDALDRLIGEDDLVAVMTPEMSARDITFARKTTTIDGLLTRYWHWGERDQLNCAPIRRKTSIARAIPGCRRRPPDVPDDDRGIADEMIERRRRKSRRSTRSRSGRASCAACAKSARR